MYANLNSQVCLSVRAIQGRFILGYLYTYTVLQNVNKLVKWGSRLC